VLASFNMDLVMRTARRPEPGETLQGEFAMYLGGKGFNQAVAARRLGAEVRVIGRLGDDEFGRQFLSALDREGIERAHVSLDPDLGTGVAAIVVDQRGENAIIQAPRANRRVSIEDIRRARPAFDGAAAALLQLETSDEGAVAFAREARTRGTRVILNPAPAAPVGSELLALADVIVANEVEAAAAAKTSIDARDAARRLAAMHGADVIVTLGTDGAFAACGGKELHCPAHLVDAIDTVGAGDAFCAALAVALAEGAPTFEAVRFANAAGALATTRHGAEPSMPHRDEIETLLAKGANA